MNAQPTPGIPVGPPLTPPLPGQVIVSYTIIEPETGCCKCNDLNGTGLVVLIIGLLFFWPIALIPCCSASMKNKKQVPVYGYPGEAPVAVVPQQPVGYVATPQQPVGYVATPMQPVQMANPAAQPMPVANVEAPAAIPEPVKPGDNAV